MPSAEGTNKIRHVAVIGAGTVGACCAWYLQQAGFELTVIDPELPGQTTSYGNAGCISPSHISPFSHPGVSRKIPGWLFDPLGPLSIRWAHLPQLTPWLWRFWRSGTWKGVEWSTGAQVRLMKRVTQDWTEILAATNLSHMRKSLGVISLYDGREEFEHSKWEYDLKDKAGFEWQFLSPAELKIMVPELHLENGMALFYPDWQHMVDPGEATLRIARDCFNNGANWVQDKVSRAEASQRGVSLTLESGQKINADAMVLAAGTWSNLIARQLDHSTPLTPKRGYHSMIGLPGIQLEYPMISKSRSFVMTPMQDGLRVAGTAEFAALDAEPDYRRAKVLLEHAKHYLPDLQFNDVEEWMGQRPMMSDSVPVISPSPSHDNVFYAFGHGHYGLTQGPTTGKIITALVSGQEPEVDIHDYRFGRFRE